MEQQEQAFFTESRKKVEEYVQDRILLMRLQIVEKVSRLSAMLFSGIIIALLSFFILLFISIMAGYLFASLTGSLYIGFGIVALFYIILLIVIIKLKKRVIDKTVTDIVIKVFFDKVEEENDDEKTTI
ncbi:phage holin family protein [Chitinophagaceae bacterium LWZ2-11]